MTNKINNLILELNSNCNNNCIYCYIPEKTRSETADDNKEFFKRILIDFRRKGVNNVDFTGGEPTLYPKLFELIRLAKKLGYENRTLVTNGRMLAYKGYCKKAFDSGINRVVISIDGPDERTADAITRSHGSFRQTIAAIKNIKSLGIELGTTVVVNKLNYTLIPKTIKTLIDLGSDFINIQFLLPYVDDKNVPCKRIPEYIIPTYEESIKYVKEGLDRYGRSKKIKVHFIPFCYMLGYEKYLDEESTKSGRYVVNHRGYMYNIREHLQKGSVKTKRCEGCRFSGKCVGFFRSYSREFGTSICNSNTK